MSRWPRLAPLLGIALAASVLGLMGLTPGRATLAALLQVCPALNVWAVAHRSRDSVQ